MLIMVVALDGLVQLGGAAFVIVGFATPQKRQAKASSMLLRPCAMATRNGSLVPGVAGSF